MAKEIEAKIRVASEKEFATVRRRLQALGAEFLGRSAEIDTYFDTPSGSLRRKDCALRIRVRKPLELAADGCDRRLACRLTEEEEIGQARRLSHQTGQAGRLSHPIPLLTYKGPRQSGSSLKVRQEIQTHVENGRELAKAFEQLGYVPTLVVRKQRASYRLGPCMVELDILPRLGRFVEVEGPSAKAVKASLDKLGLTGPLVKETYIAMVAKLRQSQ